MRKSLQVRFLGVGIAAVKLGGRRARLITLALLVALAAGGGGATVRAEQLSGQDQRSYQADLAGLRADLGAARMDGFTDGDLAPVEGGLAAVSASSVPADPWRQATFFAGQVRAVDQLRRRLAETRARLRESTLGELQDDLTRAQAGLEQDRALGVPDGALAELQTALAAAAPRSDFTLAQLRSQLATARAALAEIETDSAAQQQENQAITDAAGALLAQARGDLGVMRAQGQAALVAGRNDATVAAYEARAGRFPAMAPLNDAYQRLEHFAGLTGQVDPTAVSYAVAALQRYAGRIHDLLLANLGPQHVIVSFQAQHVWVYQGSKVVMDSAVTTGIRGITDYGTDFGPMKVLFKSHPWRFHSPYPTWSRYWYPDTTVQWTVFFTNSGESFHDAYWEADSELGPGSQYNPSTRSHGCIHLPYAKAEWLFGWADVGTPVDVVPGDGQPLAAQLTEITTDNQGNPLNPA